MWRRVLGVLLAGWLVACQSSPSQPRHDAAASPSSTPSASPGVLARPSTEAPQPEAPERYNVVLLLVDSMRADMPWAGYSRDIAPNLTRLERKSISYTRAYSVSSYTAKSVAAALSGKYPSMLFRSAPFFTHYPDSNLFLAELLAEAGVRTLSAHAHMYMKRGSGLDQGFHTWQLVDGIRFDNKTDNHVTSHKLTPLAIELLEAAPANEPFFLYLHYMDPHDVYVKHEQADFGSELRDRYDSEMFYTDLWIGKLLDFMQRQPWWHETVVIVSADHGEAFGEHGMHRHAFELWNVLTHVPLFFHVPGAAPRRIDAPRSHIDLAPTILDLMNVKAAHDFVGHSLLSELRGGPAEARPVLLDLPRDTNNPERRAMITGDDKLLFFDTGWRVDLYDLSRDPAEQRNLAQERPDKLAELRQQFDREWARYRRLKPFGGNKLTGGGVANGPMQPARATTQ